MAQHGQPLPDPQAARLLDQYRAAIQSASTEAAAYWTRITVFVLLNSALLVARGALPVSPPNHWARIAVTLLGLCTTVLWAHTAVRAHYTSAFWQGFLRDLELQLGWGSTGPYTALTTFYSRLRVSLPDGVELKMPWIARGNVNDTTSAVLTAVFLIVWIVAAARLA